MDYELSMALLALWFASTLALFIAAAMFLHNSGEAFHPHSIVMEQRHKYFSVVGANTVCKTEFSVKSVSAYFAPRGSSSDKIFTVLIVLCAVAGFLGTVRWHAIGDASYTEALLCQVGFAAMILVVTFEVPTTPQSFFQDKLLLTYWMMMKLQLQPYLDFKISPTSRKFLEFIRNSGDLRHLYEEDLHHEMRPVSTFATFTLGFNLHALGASLFVGCVTMAVILNDSQESRVAVITGGFFVMFAAMGYISGTYLPAAAVTRGMILLWNPFIREPNFLIKLQNAAVQYHLDRRRDMDMKRKKKIGSKHASGPLTRRMSRSKASEKMEKEDEGEDEGERVDLLVRAVEDTNRLVDRPVAQDEEEVLTVLSESEMSQRAGELLRTHYNLRWAHSAPAQYTRVLSHLMVTVELAAMITPIIALGVQWMMALCESSDTPHVVFFAAVFTWGECLWTGDFECLPLQESCIMFR